MRIGEIVEILIQIRDDCFLSSNEDEAVCAACNILSKLPRTEDELEVQERMTTL